MEDNQQQDSGQQKAVGECCKRGGHHVHATNVSEGLLSNRQFKLKCLPKAMLPDVLQKGKPKSETKHLKLTELKILKLYGGW